MAATLRQQRGNPLDQHLGSAFLRRVRIRGFKSIGLCDVALQPLTVLVGPNGSGKSNFLDALAFLADVFRFDVAEAIRQRGGIDRIRCRSARSSALEIEIEAGFVQQPDTIGYRLTVPMLPGGGIDGLHEYWTVNEVPLASSSADHPLVRDFSNRLRQMGVCNFHPDAIRAPRKYVPGSLLDRCGANLPGILALLEDHDPGQLERVSEYLSTIAPEVLGVSTVRHRDDAAIVFDLRTGPGQTAEKIEAACLSDGILRALASLLAAFQFVPPHGRASMVGIEEPETALHPAAMHTLVCALQEATSHTQILLTTHSADLLAQKDLDVSQVLVVRCRDGQTRITPVDAASREIVRKEMYTLADLQRMDQFDLDDRDIERQEQAAQSDGNDFSAS